MRTGGQPLMECPICEAYKSASIDTPQHIEALLLEKYGEGNTNNADARAERLQLLKSHGYLKNPRLQGRTTKAVHEPTASRTFL